MISTPLSKALRTTAAHIQRLKELGMESVEDFLKYFPRAYTDQRNVRKIIEVKVGELNVIRGVIKSIKTSPTWRRRMPVTTALIGDESGALEAIWFNQAYLGRTLKTGMEILLSGKVKYEAKRGRIFMQNPIAEIIKKEQVHTARIVPVYHETELSSFAARRVQRKGKISSKWIREKMFNMLPFAEYFPEYLPEAIRRQYRLMPLAQAVKNAHFPKTETELNAAKHRLAFDELFLLQLAALYRRALWRRVAQNEKKQIPPDWELIKKFTASLPWPLTPAQKKAIYEILKDLEKPFPMSRLLSGDTGSGKTVVAAAAALQAITAGFQVCLLAPTEILSRQHFYTFSAVLEPFNIKSKLLVGSTPTQEKKLIKEHLCSGALGLVIGTHALLQENVKWRHLGLAIIDEQHRFGVKQRETLKTHGSPHVLNLTATPIPRTLALVLYGDQDISVLDEMPPGRQKIFTRIVPEEKRPEAYKWIEKEIGQGRQAFFIFPLIEESEELQVKAAVQEFELLNKTIFSHLKLGLLHGQMSAAEKEKIMKMFSANEIQILVSTAVVEVGVDIPNATIMIIEGAERFGLAQLHQFRGRVGRGSHQSYCLLFPTLQTPQISQRLAALVKHNSGFKLAEIDLKLRGPGEVYGTAQSGIPDLKMANLSDAVTLKQTRDAAVKIIEIDPDLKMNPALKQKILEQENVATA